MSSSKGISSERSTPKCCQNVQPKTKKAIKITLLVLGILALLGGAYALTGHFVGFGTMNGWIAQKAALAGAAIKYFYTHLNIWQGALGVGLPAVAVAILGTAAAVKIHKSCQNRKKVEKSKLIEEAREEEVKAAKGSQENPFIVASKDQLPVEGLVSIPTLCASGLERYQYADGQHYIVNAGTGTEEDPFIIHGQPQQTFFATCSQVTGTPKRADNGKLYLGDDGKYYVYYKQSE